MKSYSELLDEFKEISAELEKLIIKFPKEKVEITVFDKWSLKNVVSHLNHWMEHDILCLESLQNGIVPFWEPDVEEFNRKGVEARKDYSWDIVFKEFLDLKAKLINIFKNLELDLENARIWPDKNETPRRFLEEDIKHWRDEHIKSLNDFFNK